MIAQMCDRIPPENSAPTFESRGSSRANPHRNHLIAKKIAANIPADRDSAIRPASRPRLVFARETPHFSRTARPGSAPALEGSG